MKTFRLGRRFALLYWPALIPVLWLGGDRPPASHAAADAPGAPLGPRRSDDPPDSPTSVARQRVVGQRLLDLRPGMTRPQVEAIIGPADDPREHLSEGLMPGDRVTRLLLCKAYYVRLPHLPELPPHNYHFVWIVYDMRGPAPVFLEWNQPPHFCN